MLVCSKGVALSISLPLSPSRGKTSSQDWQLDAKPCTRNCKAAKETGLSAYQQAGGLGSRKEELRRIAEAWGPLGLLCMIRDRMCERERERERESVCVCVFLHPATLWKEDMASPNP